MQETWVQSLGCEDPLEEGMTTRSSSLAWRLPMDGGTWWATVHGARHDGAGTQMVAWKVYIYVYTHTHTHIIHTYIYLYAAKSLQSFLTLCNPIDGSPPGSPIPGILQARTLEWVAISFSSAWKWKVKVKLLSRIRLSATPWTAAFQAPPSMGFSRQEYWSGVPLPSLIL